MQVSSGVAGESSPWRVFTWMAKTRFISHATGG